MDNIKNISPKLVNIMQDCAYVQKNGENSFNHYKYVTATDVLKKINESCVRNGVATTVKPELIEYSDRITNNGKTEKHAVVRVVITLIDTASGEYLELVGIGSGQDTGDKAIMKAQTASIKYAWMLSLNISTGDDPEADIEVDKRVNEQPVITKSTRKKTDKVEKIEEVKLEENINYKKKLTIYVKEKNIPPEYLRIVSVKYFNNKKSSELTEEDCKKMLEIIDVRKKPEANSGNAYIPA